MRVNIVYHKQKELWQLGDDYATDGGPRPCAVGGCPAVVDFIDNPPDTFFNMHWQFYLVAINMGMSLDAIVTLMGYRKAFMNRIGLGNPDEPRNNYITGTAHYLKNPATDKFRSMNLNTHECIEDGDFIIPLAMDGSQPPMMKPGRPRPKSLGEIIPGDYLYMPWSHPELFIDCTNVQWKTEPKRLAYGPFAHGVERSWIHDGRIHTYFPFVSIFKEVRTPKAWWKKVDTFPSAFRV